jgi:hypothetical protein
MNQTIPDPEEHQPEEGDEETTGAGAVKYRLEAYATFASDLSDGCEIKCSF